MSLNKVLKVGGGSLHKSEMKKIISIEYLGASSVDHSQLMITTADKLPIGVPLQVQFEVIPEAPIVNKDDSAAAYAYVTNIKSVKARIKPGTLEFNASEEKNLQHIIDGTENLSQEKERTAKKIKKAAEKENERFTGLEIQ